MSETPLMTAEWHLCHAQRLLNEAARMLTPSVTDITPLVLRADAHRKLARSIAEVEMLRNYYPEAREGAGPSFGGQGGVVAGGGGGGGSGWGGGTGGAGGTGGSIHTRDL